MQNIVAFIPARGGSKSIPKKNIKLLGGKPLIAYSIQSAIQAGLRPIVNTDSEEIAKVAKEYGAEVMMRPSNIAGDKTSMFEVLSKEIPKISPIPELVLLLQPTSPLRQTVHLKHAISYMVNSPGFDSLIAVEQVPEKYNPAQVIIGTQSGKGMVMGKLPRSPRQALLDWFLGRSKFSKPSLTGVPIASRITRRQDHPEAWIPSGSIYIFKSSNLDKGSIYGDQVMLYESEPTTNINEPEDWELAEQELTKTKNA